MLVNHLFPTKVIPQLIARIDSPRKRVSKLIHDLLTDVGKQHPQALIYPLTVASKSQSSIRRDAANAILNNMAEHSSKLVQQAIMVSYLICDYFCGSKVITDKCYNSALREMCSAFIP